jgi:hypothetical protein
MPEDRNNKGLLISTVSPIIPRLLIITLSITLFSIVGVVGMAVYKKVPVEVWGIKIGYQVEENQSNDLPFLVTEVQQLKEQRKLLEKRLVKLLDENELQKNRLNECKDGSHLSSKG